MSTCIYLKLITVEIETNTNYDEWNEYRIKEFDEYIETVCNPDGDQRVQNLQKLNYCANEMGSICAQLFNRRN